MSKELTPKEKLFAETYLINGFNATDAYLKAGYKESDYVRQDAYKLTTKPYIRKYLDEAIDALIGDRKGMLKDLIEECKRYAFMSPEKMDIEQVRPSDKKAFVDLMFKYLGVGDKSEVVHKTIDENGEEKGITINISIPEMNES